MAPTIQKENVPAPAPMAEGTLVIKKMISTKVPVRPNEPATFGMVWTVYSSESKASGRLDVFGDSVELAGSCPIPVTGDQNCCFVAIALILSLLRYITGRDTSHHYIYIPHLHCVNTISYPAAMLPCQVYYN